MRDWSRLRTRGIAQVEPLDGALVPAEHAGIAVQRPAALMLPTPPEPPGGRRRRAWRRRRCAGARSRSRCGRSCAAGRAPSSCAKATMSAAAHATDRRGPFGRAGRQMRLEPGGIVGVARPCRRGPRSRRGTGHVHHPAGQRPVGARPHERASRRPAASWRCRRRRPPRSGRRGALRALTACVMTLTCVTTALVPQSTTQSDVFHLARIEAGHPAVPRPCSRPRRGPCRWWNIGPSSAWRVAGG